MAYKGFKILDVKMNPKLSNYNDKCIYNKSTAAKTSESLVLWYRKFIFRETEQQGKAEQCGSKQAFAPIPEQVEPA